jgi:digeranylgeranylglycerophospholipid reductase
MTESYDVVVVGAGPGGSYAAKIAAEGGARVLIVERKREVGAPVRCAEAISSSRLSAFYPPEPRWAPVTITAFEMVSPDGHRIRVTTGEAGYILERRIFDRMIAEDAARSGVRIVADTQALGLVHENGTLAGVRLLQGERERTVACRVVIGADGVESRVARWAGLRTQMKVKDLECVAQYTMAGVDLDTSVCQMYFGRKVAPGGYAWAFPKGPGIANVGLGIAGHYAEENRPFEMLDRFVERHFPGVSIIARVAGGVPCAPALKRLSGRGCLVVGDAARQCNPVSGAGIITAMRAGEIAGRVAAETALEGLVTDKALARYDVVWQKTYGTNHERYYRLKTAISRFEDDDLNAIARNALKVSEEKRSVGRVFAVALWNQPRLLWEASKVFF